MEYKEDSKMVENVYDVLLSKCKEPKYMKAIRNLEKRMGFVTPIRWIDSIFIVTVHVTTVLYVLNIIVYGWPKWQTISFVILLVVLAGFGVTGGVHRHWTHRCYKAKWPLKLILIICYSIAGQNPIGAWVLDHRVHHKYSDTSADPYNAKRGLFFSHVGWLMMKRHPEVIRNGKKIDMSDIELDPFVQFHTRHFFLLKVMLCWVLPSLVPWLTWGETLSASILSQAFFRYVYTLNGTWTVNSLAHFYGYKPFDPNIMPSENWLVSKISFGEGWHNYHHTFPWDYKASEFGVSDNLTTTFIDFFAWIGWAYDLKEAAPELVKSVVESRKEKDID